MTILNYTYHKLYVYNIKNEITEFESKGYARFKYNRTIIENDKIKENLGLLTDYYKVNQCSNLVIGLPEPQDDTYFIVEEEIARFLKDERSDLVIPGVMVSVRGIDVCDGFLRV